MNPGSSMGAKGDQMNLYDPAAWGSPAGLAIFFVGLGIFIYLISQAGKGKSGK